MKDLHIALIQSDLHWEDIPANLKMFDEKINSMAEAVDLIILPEMFSTGFSMNPERLAEPMNGSSAVNWMLKKARERNCVITGSLMLADTINSTMHYYNRLIWAKADGSYETYDKKHLFSISLEPRIYSPGDKRLIQELHGWKICPMICYDLRFPVWSRNAMVKEREAEYDVLIYCANWPEPRVTAWKTLLQARAIENLSYVIGANRTGQDGTGMAYTGESSVIDPLGAILYRKEKEQDIAILQLSFEELQKARRQFPFLKDADAFDLK